MIGAALRSLLRRPLFTAAAAGTLAIGIAATTTLFTTVNAVLLQPLPYPRSQDIFAVRTFFPSGRFTIGLVASEEMAEVEKLSDMVAGVAMTARTDGALQTDGQARQV